MEAGGLRPGLQHVHQVCGSFSGGLLSNLIPSSSYIRGKNKPSFFESGAMFAKSKALTHEVYSRTQALVHGTWWPSIAGV